MVYAIFISKNQGDKQIQMDCIEVISKKGIIGDRNFNKSKYPGQNITFIEFEEIENFNLKFNQDISIFDTRRNVITRGIRLNNLVGKTFQIGNTILKGVELCEPCEYLGEILKNDTISKKDVIKGFLHKSGLRADVISDGKICTGMRLEICYLKK